MSQTTSLRALPAVAAAALLAVIATIGAHAQSHGGHAGHAGHAGNDVAATDAASDSTRAFQSVNAKMHTGMDIKFTGNADVDFVRGMIPHHQGAIDMAEVVLKHGKDPEVRKLAQAIIREQKKEIAWMNAWLKKNAK